MKTQAAILWERGGPWSVEEIDLDPPKHGEVLVEMGGTRGHRRPAVADSDDRWT